MLPPPTTTPSVTPSRACRDEIGGDAIDGRLMDAETFRAAQRLAGQLDDDTAVGGLSHDATPPPSDRADGRQRDRATSALAGRGRDLGGEIAFLLLDALAERVAHETGDLDRRADLAFGFLQRLRDALLVVEYRADRAGRPPCRRSSARTRRSSRSRCRACPAGVNLSASTSFSRVDRGRIEPGRIDRLRIGRGDVHRDHAGRARPARRPCRCNSSATITPILPSPSVTELCT